MKKYLWLIITFVTMLSCSFLNKESRSKNINLTEKWDTLRVLENPDKGWYHHLLDNGIEKYPIKDEQKFLDFPGIDHLYLRLAWSYFDRKKGSSTGHILTILLI